MGLRAATIFPRRTLTKAFAVVVSEAETGDVPDGAFRRVRIVLRQGIAVFRILDDGIDANTEIASSRTFEWSELEGPINGELHFDLRPNQVLWGMVQQTNKAAPGLMKCSAIVEFHDGGR